MTHSYFKATFRGRLWQRGDTWLFEEDGAACRVEAVVPEHLSAQNIAAWVEARLYKAVRAEHVKAAKQANATAWKRAVESNVPKTTGDMAVKGTTPKGKLTYRWEAVEVDVTPRRLRGRERVGAGEGARGHARASLAEDDGEGQAGGATGGERQARADRRARP